MLSSAVTAEEARPTHCARMIKVILTQRLKSAAPGDCIYVKRGYALNFLVPNGMAILYSQRNLAIFDEMRHAIELKDAESQATAKALCEKLDGVVLNIACSHSEEGRLYSAIGPRQVASELSKIIDQVIPAAFVKLEGKIKNIGEYLVRVTPYEGLGVNVMVVISGSGMQS